MSWKQIGSSSNSDQKQIPGIIKDGNNTSQGRDVQAECQILNNWERIRFTKEGTTRTSRQITQIGSKTGQITGGELRMEGYLGKIPYIKESLYSRERESTSTLSATLTS